jgi:hypothetical protein
MEVRTEPRNADVQEAVVCVGQDHQLVVVAHELQRSRHVLVGTPAAYSLSELCAGAFGRPDAPALAHPVKGILKDLLVGLVVAADLVEPVPAEHLLERGPLLVRKTAREQPAGGRIDVEVDQRAVAVKGDVLRPEGLVFHHVPFARRKAAARSGTTIGPGRNACRLGRCPAPRKLPCLLTRA